MRTREQYDFKKSTLSTARLEETRLFQQFPSAQAKYKNKIHAVISLTSDPHMQLSLSASKRGLTWTLIRYRSRKPFRLHVHVGIGCHYHV